MCTSIGGSDARHFHLAIISIMDLLALFSSAGNSERSQLCILLLVLLWVGPIAAITVLRNNDSQNPSCAKFLPRLVVRCPMTKRDRCM